MSRTVFAVDDLLDAARSCVLAEGVRKTTVAAVARRSGAPVGSIYHRFAGIDDVLAGAWIRAVSRSQAGVGEVDTSDLARADVAAALAVASFDFCLRHPDDVRLLERLTRRDVLGLKLSPATLDQVREVDERSMALMGAAARRLGDDGLSTTALVVIELPQTFARSALAAADTVELDARRRQLDAAVRAVIATVTSARSGP
ncbi:TetR/AcrR family transcriptional regulator [Williamsia deligens]|uniref:TetR family transcriptional regulator n=1 Tax=Williamsia deligens TaxID=321325 RepID=A0ABW3G9E3_9NOCA|nr:TetR/AcrR family transcriptional regulator [Williamsia deligens]MCP2193730.1 transcriptional regulator, TetR family [Williamsia deligens]